MPKEFSTKSNHLSYYLKINSITNTRFDSYTCTFPIFRKSAGLNWQKITCTFALFAKSAGADKYRYIIISQAMDPEVQKRLLKQENLNDE